MREVLDVNILEDEKTQRKVAYIGMPAAVAAFAVLVWQLIAGLLGGGATEAETFWGGGLGWTVAACLAYVVSLPVHELVHAAFFKLLGPAGVRVRFGFKSGMLYTGCPGVRFGRHGMATVLLAPFVALSLVYLALGIALGLPFLALVSFLLHLSGCGGDLYFVWLIARHPEADFVEDTPAGIRLIADEGAGERR